MNADLRRKLNRITDILWAGGVTNPVTYIEQISYLIYLKLLDEEESNREMSPSPRPAGGKNTAEKEKNLQMSPRLPGTTRGA